MYDTTYNLKDIVARYNLREFKILEEISAFLLANSGIAQSVNKLKNNFHISYDMANTYLEYLIKAYMLFEIPKIVAVLESVNYFTISIKTLLFNCKILEANLFYICYF